MKCDIKITVRSVDYSAKEIVEYLMFHDLIDLEIGTIIEAVVINEDTEG